MPRFTAQMEREYADLFNEGVRVIDDEVTCRMYTRTLWTMRVLYESDPYWNEQTPTFITTLKHTWIMETVTEIAGSEDCDQWLNDQNDEEDFRHPDKTPERMAELASLSGLARIMFNSTVDKQWVHPIMKAYWYVLAWDALPRGETHQEAMVLSTGHHVTVFPF